MYCCASPNRARNTLFELWQSPPLIIAMTRSAMISSDCSAQPLFAPLLHSYLQPRTNRPSKVHDQSNVKLITKVCRELNFCGDLENLCTSTLVRVRLAQCSSKQKNKHKHNLCTNKSIRTSTTAINSNTVTTHIIITVTNHKWLVVTQFT